MEMVLTWSVCVGRSSAFHMWKRFISSIFMADVLIATLIVVLPIELYLNTSVAIASEEYDGTYIIFSSADRQYCTISVSKIVITGNRAIWRASHTGSGTVTPGGLVTIYALDGHGLPAKIEGSVASGNFDGTEIAADCSWKLHGSRRQ